MKLILLQCDNSDNAFLTNYWINHSNISKIPKELKQVLSLIDKIPADKIKSINSTRGFYKPWYDDSTRIPRVQQKYPDRPWTQIWKYFALPQINTDWKTSAYCIIIEIILIIDNQKRHGMRQSDLCINCASPDTLSRRITQCLGANIVWKWVSNKVKLITKIDRTLSIDSLYMLCLPTNYFTGIM